MELTYIERSMLDGAKGEAVQRALEYQLKVAEYYKAERFVPVTQVHMTADIDVMGDLGLAFLEEQANLGARFVVPTTTNARCVDFGNCNKLGQCSDSTGKEERIRNIINKMGAITIDTCINYQTAYQPRMNEHVAWGDTGTVIYANSVFGARTNFESGPAAFAAALTGRVPAYGFHLDENRKGTIIFDIEADIKDLADWGILGWFIGSRVFDYNVVPVLNNVARFSPTTDDLKHFGASMATWSLAMFHAVGVTPEARTLEEATGGRTDIERITISDKDLKSVYEKFNDFDEPRASVVVFSGPQLSIAEIRNVANMLEGKKVNKDTTLIITCSEATLVQAKQAGFADTIERAGGIFLTGVCFYILDGLSEIRKANGWKTLVTNSAKLANNVKVHRFVPVVRSTRECIDIAIRGWIE